MKVTGQHASGCGARAEREECWCSALFLLLFGSGPQPREKLLFIEASSQVHQKCVCLLGNSKFYRVDIGDK